MTKVQTVPGGRGGAAGQMRSGISLLLVLLLVSGIVINVAQFHAIEERGSNDNFDAVGRWHTADAVQMLHAGCTWCRERFEPHLALRVVAPGSTVYVPADSPYRSNRYLSEELTFRLYSLADVAEVELPSYRQDPGLLSSSAGPPGTGFDPTPYIIASGPGGPRGAAWVLAISPPEPTGITAGPDSYLTTALRDGEHRRRSGPPREFAFLRWEVPREGNRRPYQDLLLETSLLPDEVRAELTR